MSNATQNQPKSTERKKKIKKITLKGIEFDEDKLKKLFTT